MALQNVLDDPSSSKSQYLLFLLLLNIIKDVAAHKPIHSPRRNLVILIGFLFCVEDGDRDRDVFMDAAPTTLNGWFFFIIKNGTALVVYAVAFNATMFFAAIFVIHFFSLAFVFFSIMLVNQAFSK